MTDDKMLAGSLYRMLGRTGSSVVHVRSFLARRARLEREKREVTREGARETPFLELVPDWFDYVPRESRFFQDWQESSRLGRTRLRALGTRHLRLR